MNIVNFALAYGLIFGKLGFQRMGVEGVGIASMVSSFVGLAVMLAFTFGPRVRRDFKIFYLPNLDARIMKELVKLSVPSGLATLFVMSGFGIFFVIVAFLDVQAGNATPIYASATSNIVTILQLTFMTCLAYGTGTATLVSQSMGAKKFDLAAEYGWEAVKLGVYVFTVVGIVMFCFPHQVLSIWTKDAAVIETAVPVLRMLAFIQPFIVAGIVLTQALFGAGNTLYVMVVEFILHFTCLAPLSYLLGVTAKLAIMGVFMSAAAYVLLLTLIMGLKFRSGDWKAIEI
jgi:Na+-driven multidrug efflux pump